MAQVTLAIPMGFPRADQPDFLDRDVVDEVEFAPEERLFTEALADAGYIEAARAEWMHYGGREWRAHVDGRLVYVAEVVQ